jgi:hypothetical protein
MRIRISSTMRPQHLHIHLTEVTIVHVVSNTQHISYLWMFCTKSAVTNGKGYRHIFRNVQFLALQKAIRTTRIIISFSPYSISSRKLHMVSLCTFNLALRCMSMCRLIFPREGLYFLNRCDTVINYTIILLVVFLLCTILILTIYIAVNII